MYNNSVFLVGFLRYDKVTRYIIVHKNVFFGVQCTTPIVVYTGEREQGMQALEVYRKQTNTNVWIDTHEIWYRTRPSSNKCEKPNPRQFS